MKLFEKGEISFVFLWILNPIVILFYQNCSPSRLDATTAERAWGTVSRVEKTKPAPERPAVDPAPTRP